MSAIDSGRYCLDADLIGPGHAHDAGAGLLLRRTGAEQERSQHHHAQLHRRSGREHYLGALGLQPRLRAGPLGLHRRPRLVGAARRGTGTGALLRHHPPPGVHALPAHVRHHHPGADHRRLRRAGEVQHLPGVHSAWSTLVYCARGPLGLGATTAGCASWGRWTSPAARWCTSTPAWRPWWRPSSSAGASASGGSRWSRTTSLCGAGRRPALVRLVRLQRRQRRSPRAAWRPTPSW